MFREATQIRPTWLSLGEVELNPNNSENLKVWIYFQEFGWSDFGYDIAGRLGLEKLANAIDAKFDVITNLTYRNIGNFEAVDTRLFRMAVQRYALCLFGIRYDDYNYGQINLLLQR